MCSCELGFKGRDLRLEMLVFGGSDEGAGVEVVVGADCCKEFENAQLTASASYCFHLRE